MADGRFKDRVVFVTGAASGVGRAAAERFATEGARVFGVDVNRDGVSETVATIRRAGGCADGGHCNVADPAAVNLTGPFLTTRAAMPHLLRGAPAAIVNVASTAGMRGQAYMAHYGASKAG